MNKIILVFVCLLILGNSAFAQKNKNKQNTLKAANTEVKVAEKYAKYILEERLHDFGIINENGGLVSYNFAIKNIGSIPLKIKDIQAECGCTKTEYTTQPIEPGAVGNIKAVFNPMGRPGYFDKSINLFLNTEDGKTTIFIKGNVAPAKYEFNSTYTYQYGLLAVNNNTFKFNVNPGKTDSTYLKMYNLSNKKIIVHRIETPSNIVVSGSSFELIPNTDIDLLIKFWPRLDHGFGDHSQQIKLYTNDDSIPVKIIYINSNVSEDFSVLTPKQLKKAPKFTIDRILHDFGDIGHRDSSITHFILTNKGKSDLIIRKAKPSCNCVNLELESMVIKPKQKIKMKVDYTSFNVVGLDIRGITLITNDPEKPEVNIAIRANIVR